MTIKNRISSVSVAKSAALALVLGSVAGLPTAAHAAQRTVSGTSKGLSWIAGSRIVGQTSTGLISEGGDPVYAAEMPKYSGVVSLIMEYDDGSAFICSGSLMSDRRSIVTAAHCVSGGPGSERPAKTTAYFYAGDDPDTITFLDPDATAVEVSRIYVNREYTGEVIDENDIAVLRLEEEAPAFAVSYDLYTDPDLTGLEFNVAGYGARSDVGGSIGANRGVGRLRQGDNRYDFALGDEAFGGFWEGFFGSADVTYSYLSDFDNGISGNDTSCSLASFFGAGGAQFCDTGVGALEVGVAGGDSGGPQFIDGKLASVTSYGLTFGAEFGDVDDELNSSFGEFSGYVPIFIHLDFIKGVVPEPATWAMMIIGFGAVGISARRQRRALAAA